MGWFGSDSTSTSSTPSGYGDSGFSKDFGSDEGFSSSSGSSSGFDSGFNPSTFSSPSSGPGAGGLDSASLGGGGGDPELQSFLMMEQQRAQFQAMVHKLADSCWDLCMGQPGSKLESRTEACVSNCTDRYIDSTLFITNRMAQLLQKQAGM